MPIAEYPEESLVIILYGSEDVLNVSMDYAGGNSLSSRDYIQKGL